VPWYVGSGINPQELEYADRWLRAAKKAGVEPLVGFGHGFSGWTRRNEANHCSQPTCKRPARVARYYDALKGGCPTCTVIGAAVIDQPNMVSWLRRFRRAAKREPTIYGLHNYLDVNRLRTTGTRRLLRAVPRSARVWITETGGVVRRRHKSKSARDFPENPTHAGLVTKYVLRTARRLRRIDRVYLYHWNVDRRDATWDSGLIDFRGKARPGFAALARHLKRNPRLAPPALAPAPTLPGAPVPPIAQNPPPTEPQPQSQPSQTGSAPATEAPASCGLAMLCDRPLGGLLD
jgi:hypothetical protein